MDFSDILRSKYILRMLAMGIVALVGVAGVIYAVVSALVDMKERKAKRNALLKAGILTGLVLVLAGIVYFKFVYESPKGRFVSQWMNGYTVSDARAATGTNAEFVKKLTAAAAELTEDEVEYDATYLPIPYPNGDVPKDIGVCTDVVIRAYRKVGIDLQKEVHEDMVAHYSLYPKLWDLRHTDTNIDHRRVPNLMVFFGRKGVKLPVTKKAEDYKPGDIVCWDVAEALPHIGLVSNRKAKEGRYFVVHNIGAGQVFEDMLFEYKIIGHFRYDGK